MSDQQRVPPDQDPPILAYAQVVDDRPGILKALGIISIVLGSLGILTSAGAAINSVFSIFLGRISMMAPPGGGPSPFANLPVAPFVINALLNLLSLGLAVYLVVCGALLLRDRPSGRAHHLRYAVAKCVLAVPVAAVSFWSTYAMQSSIMANMQTTAPAPGPVPVATFAYAAGAVMAGFWMIVSLAYPVTLLIALNTRQVRDYYARLKGPAVVDRPVPHQ